MELERTPLLLERSRPSVAIVGRHKPRTISGMRGEHSQRKITDKLPKSRTRNISNRRKLGPARRDLFARLERRTRDRATPQSNEILRSSAKLKYIRRKGEKPLIRGQRAVRNELLKGLTR